MTGVQTCALPISQVMIERYSVAGGPDRFSVYVGGTITFGGGFGLYNGATAVGGVGLSGDTACADL